MGAATCTGRKDDAHHNPPSFGWHAPAYAVEPSQVRPVWQHEFGTDPFDFFAATFLQDEDEVDSEEALLEPLHVRISALLAVYSSEVHDGHGLLTAADSYYFSLLEFQRRHDSVGIQAAAVHQMLESDEAETNSWRQSLAAKRAEAVEALANRAKHYAVGRRSSQGLLQITSGSRAETLRGYEALLDKEYELAASEIQATLSALSAEPETERRGHAQTLLQQLQRSEKFWTSQIEETFEVWQAASVRLNQAQVNRNGAWGELLPVTTTLLAELHPTARLPRTDKDPGPEHSAIMRVLSAARTQCCVRLLELDLHQHAHGLSSAPRRQLLSDLFLSCREDLAMPRVARALLYDPSFQALQGMQIGDSGLCVLDVQTAVDHPWTSMLAEIFGELLCVVSESSPQKPVDPELLRTVEEFLVRQPGLQEVRLVAAAYTQPRTGRTALHQATFAQSTWLCKRLLEFKADPLACEASGFSPLSIAEQDSHCPVALRESLKEATQK